MGSFRSSLLAVSGTLSLSILHAYPTSFESTVVFMSRDLVTSKCSPWCCDLPEFWPAFPSSETCRSGLYYSSPQCTTSIFFYTKTICYLFAPSLSFVKLHLQFPDITIWPLKKKKQLNIIHKIGILLFQLCFTSVKKILVKICPSINPSGNPCADSSPTWKVTINPQLFPSCPLTHESTFLPIPWQFVIFNSVWCGTTESFWKSNTIMSTGCPPLIHAPWTHSKS